MPWPRPPHQYEQLIAQLRDTTHFARLSHVEGRAVFDALPSLGYQVATLGTDLPPADYTETIIRLRNHTPLSRLTVAESKTVFDRMAALGYAVVKADPEPQKAPDAA